MSWRKWNRYGVFRLHIIPEASNYLRTVADIFSSEVRARDFEKQKLIYVIRPVLYSPHTKWIPTVYSSPVVFIFGQEVQQKHIGKWNRIWTQMWGRRCNYIHTPHTHEPHDTTWTNVCLNCTTGWETPNEFQHLPFKLVSRMRCSRSMKSFTGYGLVTTVD